MSYTIKDLNPPKPSFSIDAKALSFSFVTLELHNTIDDLYGSLENMYDAIRNEPTQLMGVAWLFLNEKYIFNDREKFLTFVYSSKESLKDVATKFSKALDTAVSLSMPLVKNQKRLQELAEIKNQEEENTVCYVSYYDSLAKRYGYTIEDFYKLTLRQVHLLLNIIGDKSYEELEIQAALQGRKLKPRMKVLDISEEQEADQEADAMEALRRLQEQYKQKQDKMNG